MSEIQTKKVSSPSGYGLTLDPANGAVTVDGSVSATSFTGDGSSLTGVTSKVLQVVTLTKVNEWTTTSNSFVDVSGLVASITPTSSTSTILITASISFSSEGTGWGEHYFRLAKNGAGFAVGTASGNVMNCSFGGLSNEDGHRTQTGCIIFEDAPSTTSAISYSVQASCASAGNYGNIVYVNDSAQPSTNYSGNGISTITLTELGE